MKTAKEMLNEYLRRVPYTGQFNFEVHVINALARLEEKLDKLESKDINQNLNAKDTNSIKDELAKERFKILKWIGHEIHYNQKLLSDSEISDARFRLCAIDTQLSIYNDDT